MAKRGRKTRTDAGYTISAVAEIYHIHPQTLRLYEREGILLPSRSRGNTRLYVQRDLERLEFILKLARDLGVNISGIHIILNMRERMAEMEKEMQAFVEFVQKEFYEHPPEESASLRTALVRVGRPNLAQFRPGGR